MSRLDELIQELCPNGVDYKPIGDCVCKTSNIKWATADGSYSYIDLTSVDRDTHKITEVQTIHTDNAPSRAQQIVLEGDVLFATTRPTLKRFCLIDNEYDGQICSTGFCVLRAKENLISPRWLFHIVSSSEFYFYVKENQKGASYPAISDKEVKQFKMPVPPLEVQSEIVRILDNFTELTARKKQYEHYRNKLFSFNVLNCATVGNSLNNIVVMPLGEVGIFTRGSGLQKKDFTQTGVGCIHYGQIYTHYGTYANRTKTFVSQEFAKKARKAKHGDLIIATTSENDEDVCKAVAWLGDEDIAISSDACFYTHSLEPKYVAYYFQTEQFQKQKRGFITGTKVRRVNTSDLAKIKIPVPSIEEQRRIVSILDKFDMLTTSISEGLPKEIELRRKQYEYYRNQLLSFPDNKATD